MAAAAAQPDGLDTTVPQSLQHAKAFRTALVWFRRDLRVSDNPALVAGLQAAETVIPVTVWAPEEEGQFQPGRCSRWWLYHSLRNLEQDLLALGTSMVYRRAPDSRTALLQLVEETGAEALFFNHLYDPISLVRDNEVKAALGAVNCHCQSFNADLLYEPWEILQPDGAPFSTFDGFWNRLLAMPFPPPLPLPVPPRATPVPPDVVSIGLCNVGLITAEEESSNQQLDYTWSPGGKGAHRMLENFVLKHLEAFEAEKAKTDRGSTSKLSPHIHYGELSMRHVYLAVRARQAQLQALGRSAISCLAYLRQMGYREWGRYLSFHFPFTHERSLLEHLRATPWNFDQRLFKAWRQGRTGYPLVDSAMCQLWSTGWMHNRSRVVCASFLVKNLLLPWQWGLKHYWDALLDADLECAALGWQYISGCLQDSHPFLHMVDLKTECRKFDPSGRYVRKWLPVLARMPLKHIHRPWEAPPHVLADAGVELGVNYPYPIIPEDASLAALTRANAVIEASMQKDSGASLGKVPFRPPSVPSARLGSGDTATPSSVRRPGMNGHPSTSRQDLVGAPQGGRRLQETHAGSEPSMPGPGKGQPHGAVAPSGTNAAADESVDQVGSNGTAERGDELMGPTPGPPAKRLRLGDGEAGDGVDAGVSKPQASQVMPLARKSGLPSLLTHPSPDTPTGVEAGLVQEVTEEAQ